MSAALRRVFNAFRFVLCFSMALFFCLRQVTPAAAQTVTHKVLTSALQDTYNGPGVHASDGNYYAFTNIIAQGYTSLTQDCPVASADTDCTYITKIAPDGTTSIFHTFQRSEDLSVPSELAAVDGIGVSSLIEASDGNLYGTALEGGAGGGGTIFRITKDGVFTLLHAFNGFGTNGEIIAICPTSLIEGSDGNFYGTVWSGGLPSNSSTYTLGFIFKMTVSGDVTVLYTFPPSAVGSVAANGTAPMSLVEGLDGKLYGTTLESAYDAANSTAIGQGTIFSFDRTSGTLTTLHNFALDGSEGDTARGQLVQGPDGALYGATGAYNRIGAISGPGNITSPYNGSVFRMTTGGSFSVLHNFTGGADGWNPSPRLIVGSDGKLYGTTTYGGINTGCTTFPGCGVAFQMSLDGTLTPYYSFLGGADSGLPNGGLIQTETGSFFGTTIGDLLQGNVGSPFLLSQTPALNPPVQLSFTKDGLSFDPTTTPAAPGTTLVLNWNVLNAYSNTARNCHAVLFGNYSGAGAWAGALYGTVSSAGYGGSVAVTPTSGGTLTYALTCGGVESGYITLNVTSSPLKIATTSLKDATVGIDYLQTLVANGGVTPYTWAVGGLPEGLTLDTYTGAISGKPTKDGKYQLAVTVTDSSTTPQKDTATIALRVNPPISIAALEFTQGIQIYQSLDDLKTSIAANGGPPMPMIAGKPAVMRVYFSPTKEVENVALQVSGGITATRFVAVQPQCSTDSQRSHANLCPSTDIYFTPPSGSWTADIQLTTVAGDQELQHETLTIKSTASKGIHLIGTGVCDSAPYLNSSTYAEIWKCGDPVTLVGKTALMAAMLPSTSVTLDLTADRVTRRAFLGLESPQVEYENWLLFTSRQLARLYAEDLVANSTADAVNNTRSVQFGIYRHDLGDGAADTTGIGTVLANYDTGIAPDIPGHAAMEADVVTRLGTDAFSEVITHEVGHTLGLYHTNLLVPALSATYPGCYNKAESDKRAWPFQTNLVQSTRGPEYPFNVSTHTLMDAASTFELMSYCTPRWLSPINYAGALTTLSGASVAGAPFARTGLRAQATDGTSTPTTLNGAFWEVTGSIASTGINLDPVFQQTMQGITDAGSGTYSIEEQDASGNALYTRYFTPSAGGADQASGSDPVLLPGFAEYIPVTQGATAIAVKDASGVVQGKVTMATAAPDVTISSPASGFSGTGVQTIQWGATNPLGTTLTSRVLYSPNNGARWFEMAELQGNSVALDFNSLPGSAGATALIRVLVSDGANTGSATSVAFTVAHKAPTTVVISNPIAGAIIPSADQLQLIGAAYDVDDGMLSGSKLTWTSDLQGDLGTGSPLAVSLVPGVHKLTLTATDSDGNAISTSTSVTIVGQGPSISLTSNVDSSSKCTTATVSASSGAMGANLSHVQYSINGGASYVDIAISSLPYTFNIPGAGDVSVIARVYDASGQSNAQSTDVSIATACAQVSLQTPVITWPTPAAISYGTALSGTQLNATASVPGTFQYSLAIGSVPSAGSQTITATFTPTDASTYSSTSASVTLNVTPVTLTITPVAAARAYGLSNPAFTYTATGFVNGQTSAVLSGAPSFTTTADISSAPGSYPIAATAGSLSSTNYSFVFGSSTLTISQASTTSAIQLSAATVASGANETITVNVAPAGSGVPSGTVSFMDGTTLLGTKTLSSGTASFTTNSLAGGTHSITVSYSGDVNFTASSATASVTVTTGAVADFTLSVTGSSQQAVVAGSAATFTFNVNPIGSSFPGDVSFTVSGLPPSSTATFSPSVVAANGGSQNVTLNIKTVRLTALGPLSLAPIAAWLILPFAMKRPRRRLGLLLLALLVFSSISCLTGCGRPTQEYKVIITATAGSAQHTSTVLLDMQ